jgi:hypothetical protein
VRNRVQEEAVGLQFHLRYQWNGQTSSAPGLYLTDFGLWADARIGWGYLVDVEAHQQRPPFDAGSGGFTVGALPLCVTVRISTPMQSITKEWVITCHGNRRLEVR